MAANQVEIEITTVYNPGQGLGAAQSRIVADAEQIGRRVEQALEQSAQRAGSAFSTLAGRVNGDLSKIRAEDIDVKVTVDTSDVRRAEGDIRDLDSIPPPQIDVDINTDEAVGGLSDAIGGVDLGSAVSAISGQLSSAFAAAGPIGAAIGGAIGLAAAVWGDDIASGIQTGFTRNKSQIDTALRTGLGGADVARIGREAGEAYSNNFGQGLDDVKDAAIILEQTLGDVTDNFDLSEVTEQALVLRDVFGIDIVEAANFAGRAVARGLVESPEQAFSLLITMAQDYGSNINDIIAITDELGGSIGRLGLDFGDAARFAGEAFEQGLVSTIDRGAEALEEFLTRLTDGDSREAIEGIGLSFEDVSNRIAQGGAVAKSAVQDIVDAFLTSEDAAEKAAFANQLFGTSLETASDVDAFVEELDRMLAGYESVEGAADRAIEQANEMTTAWDKTGRALHDLGAILGEELARQLGAPIEGLAFLVDGLVTLTEWVGNATGGVDAMEKSVVSARDATSSWWADMVGLTDATDTWWDALTNIAPALDDTEDGLSGAADAANEATDAFAELEGVIDSSADALDRWAGKGIEGAEAMIDATEAVEGLDEEMLQLIASQMDANGQFNIMTEEGARAQAAVGDVKREVADLTQAHREGEITSQTYNQQMRNLESQFRANAVAAGLNSEQIAVLTAELFGVPALTTAEVRLIENVTSGVRAVRSALAAVDGFRATTYVDTVRRTYDSAPKTYGRAAGGPVGAFADGGTVGIRQAAGGAFGVPVLVNDGAGAEVARLPGGDIVDLPTGSTIYTAEDSERMVGGVDRGGAGVHVEVHGSILTEQDLIRTIRDALFRGGFDGMGGVN